MTDQKLWGERTLTPDPEAWKRMNFGIYSMIKEHMRPNIDDILAERGYRFDHEEGKLVELDRADNPPGDDEVGDLRS
jgi:hypothetical protein